MNTTKKVTLIALALAALASFLPWATINSIFGTITLSGTSGDGKLTLLLAAAAGFLGYKATTRKPLIWASILSVLGIIGCVGNMINVSSMGDEEFAIVQVGFGLYMCLVAFLVAFFGFCAMIIHISHEKLNDAVLFASQPTTSV